MVNSLNTGRRLPLGDGGSDVGPQPPYDLSEAVDVAKMN